MRYWLIDFIDWIFMQSGFSWREWRELCKSARSDNSSFPDDWDGEW